MSIFLSSPISYAIGSFKFAYVKKFESHKFAVAGEEWPIMGDSSPIAIATILLPSASWTKARMKAATERFGIKAELYAEADRMLAETKPDLL